MHDACATENMPECTHVQKARLNNKKANKLIATGKHYMSICIGITKGESNGQYCNSAFMRISMTANKWSEGAGQSFVL